MKLFTGKQTSRRKCLSPETPEDFVMRLSLVLFTILAAAGGYFLYTHHQKSLVEIPEGIYGSNGRTELKRIDVASLYAGRVEEYLVKEGDSVVKGQVIARLKDTRAKGQVKEARSALSAAESGVKAVSEHVETVVLLSREK